MKLKIIFLITIFISGCSFDNKSGIWDNDNKVSENKKDLFSEFEALTLAKDEFQEIIDIEKNFEVKIPKKTYNIEWKDIFYSDSNNYVNFNYKNLNKLVFKSKKLTRKKIENYIIYEKENIIFSDRAGNIYVYSLKEKQLINKFNFYKKKLKNLEKRLNLIVENGIIFVSDNIGFLYSFSFKDNKVLWAKNYKIPFRSNLKIEKDKLIASNQNNNLYFFNKKTGDIIKLIPTEETTVKNKFINNISMSNDYIFFLNTYGSLYAINKKNMQIKWFINLNQSLDINPSNLFFGNIVINDEKKIVVSSNLTTYVIDSDTGSVLHKKNFSSRIKPIIANKYLFLISRNNLLIVTNLNDGRIIYSLDVNQEIAEYLKSKKKEVQLKSMMIINDKIFLYLNNSYLIKFNLRGNIENINKLPNKIKTFPIITNGSIIYLDNKNRISVVD